MTAAALIWSKIYIYFILADFQRYLEKRRHKIADMNKSQGGGEGQGCDLCDFLSAI